MNEKLKREAVSNKPKDFLEEALDVFDAYLDSTRTWALKTAANIQSDRVDQAEQSLSILTAKLGRLIKLFSLMRKSYSAEHAQAFCGPEVKGVEVHLLSVLKAIKNAQETSDKLMLADLIEHELQDNLTQWKIKVAAQLKQIVQPPRR